MLLDLNSLKDKHNLCLSGILHIGAHFGEEYSMYTGLGVTDVIFFEPVKKVFEVLSSNYKDKCILYNHALGNTSGQIEMYIEKDSNLGCSSILEPSSNYPTDLFAGKEVVEIRKLDEYTSLDFTKYNTLNIDTQGYELEVLKGAEKIMHNIKYIFTEVNRQVPEKPLDYVNAVDYTLVSEYLTKFGFKLVEVNWAGISWGDALYIKYE